MVIFLLTSTDIIERAHAGTSLVYNKGGCTGENRSPHLSWTGAPAGTRSFAITLHDPDAPRKGGWWHWGVFDLPATTMVLPSGAGDGTGSALPAGAIEIVNDHGERGYGGPCPPNGHGVHHYHLVVHALKVDRLGLSADARPANVAQAIKKKELSSAELVFLYER